MKKGTKATLLLAVIMILTGGIMSVVCLILGASWEALRYPYHNSRAEMNIEAEYQADPAEDTAWNEVAVIEQDAIMNGEDYQSWDFSAETIENLSMDVGAGTLRIEPGDHYQVEVWGFDERVNVKVRNRTLYVDCEAYDLFGWISSGASYESACPTVVVTVPEDADLGKVDCKVGIGNLTADWLRAKTVRIDVDAGSFSCSQLEATEKIEIDVDAGGAEILYGSCQGKLTVDVDAGSAWLYDFLAADTVFDVDAGDLVFNGSIEGNWKADCDVGSMEIWLTRGETDYNYMIDNDMGSVQVGSKDFSGMSNTKNLLNDAEFTGTIDCDMGSVTVMFDR
ncbi:MAG: DUF4097 domain-containing protein [Lachnospiraceae bacterium]|jgi:hypothetical protein|nr:DUF4097 domain-containing protein [Lachnospiraceae bacterium]